MLLVTKRTEDGRHSAMANPCAVRKIISSTPVRESPQAMVVPVRRKLPRRYILLPPTISEMDPNKSRVQPQDRLLTAAGQRRRSMAKLRSRAMDGRLITMRPEYVELRKVTHEMVAI